MKLVYSINGPYSPPSSRIPENYIYKALHLAAQSHVKVLHNYEKKVPLVACPDG